MNELAGLFGGGSGGGFLDPSSATSQASPFYNTNSGIFFNSSAGSTDLGAVSSSATDAPASTPNSRQVMGGNNLQNDGATLPRFSSGNSSNYLIIGAVVALVLGAAFFVFKK